ncbi:hypothetical protein [Nonomuraea typhae]|uniref:Uncharacterized protein n=1 Tax=Nonomuraea typhae TaxID=2603600 RepID=A0ABW7YRS2_9ACTN
MTVPLEEPVQVSDNGVRSFIPPTLCFVLRNRSGDPVDVVSSLLITMDARQFRDFEALALLDQFGLWCIGSVDEYDAGPEAQAPGRRFSIRKCLNNPV